VSRERLYKALKLAALAHEGQKRKGKNPAPYICHPIFVGMELLRLGYDEDTVIAGILHDTLEDTPIEKDLVKRGFGEMVLGLIKAVTEPKNPDMTKEEKRKTWESRKRAYLTQIKSAPAEARAIACLDMYANMMELKQTLEDEGVGAMGIFNVNIEKKLNHWQEELDLFAEDKDYPHSKLITEIKIIVKNIQELIKT
jgi:(p)ppGpp synthase/HD superfamily hydrolase